MSPRVSVIVPCRNEERHIGACLDSLLAAPAPAGGMEVLVIDGRSSDRTRAVVQARTAGADAGVVRLLDNPAGTTPAALNIGLAAASGDAVVIAGAHTIYPPGYVAALVAWLVVSGADGVGGVCRTRPGAPTRAGRAVAAALSHPFGVGGSRFRIGTARPRWVDTIAFGCYRRDVFTRFGGFDEQLARNQDDELNLRIVRGGGRLLLVPDVTTEYFARESLGQLWRMAYQYGRFKPLLARKLGRVMTARQLAPPALVVALAGAALGALWNPAAAPLLLPVPLAYGLVCAVAALHGGRGLGLAGRVALAAAFAVLHGGYGIGYLRGIADLLSRGDAARAWRSGVSLTR